MKKALSYLVVACYSFRMAHMFPDSVGDVDVVSDAENIKKLLKIPYSRDAVSSFSQQFSYLKAFL